MAMEGLKQAEVRQSDNASYGLLGSFIKQIPGFKEPKSDGSLFSKGLKRKNPGDATAADLAPSEDQRSISSQKPTNGLSTAPLRPNLPTKNSALGSSSANTPSSSSKTHKTTAVPAIEKGLGKLDQGASRGSYATGSSSRSKPNYNRAAPSESKDNGFPITNTSKKAKTDTRNSRRPPTSVEERVVPIPSRAQREAGNGSHIQVRPIIYGRKGKGQNGTQNGTPNPTKATKGKGKGKVEKETPSKSEIITLDEDSDEDVIPQAHQPSQSTKKDASPEPQDVFSTTENNGDTQHPSSKRPAIASQTESIESVEEPGDAASPKPIVTNVLPARPPLDVDYTSYNGTSPHWEATGFAIMPVDTTGESDQRRSRSATPTKSKQNVRPLPSSGPGPQSHIVYSQTPPRAERSAPRSPSPIVQGNPKPVPDDTVSRPEWIDEPPVIDQDDLRIFRQVPKHLRIPFVALADELDAIHEPNLYSDLTMAYLDFRGWAGQGLPERPGGANTDLNMRHVVAAQMVWRALRSAQILREEAHGQEPITQPELELEQPQASAEPDTDEPIPPFSDHVAPETTVPPSNGKPQPHALPNTPKQRPVIPFQASPEVVEQAAPAKNIERIGNFKSPEEEEQPQVDDIESPVQAGTGGFRAMSIASDDDNDEVRCIS